MSLSSHFSTLRDDAFAALLEFVGTVFFLLLGLGGIQAATEEVASGSGGSTIEEVLYISTCMGFSLLVSAWLFFRVTGGLFNPNISLALLLVGVIRPVRFVLYCVAQMLGAVAASGLVLALTPGPLAVNTVLGSNINPVQGVFIEMFITAALVLSVLMLAAEKHRATPFAPIGIGLTLFASHLWAVFYTGAAMNTARSFGPAAVTGFPYSKHWVYWVGPFLGSFLGATFYSLLKHYRYWTLTPDQATTDKGKSPRDPIVAVKSLVNSNTSDDEKKERKFQDRNGGIEQSLELEHNGRAVNGSPV
jgi:aquaporin related protein